MAAKLAEKLRECGRTIQWIVTLGLLLAATAGFYLYRRGDEQLRRFIETRIAEKYPKLGVSIGSAHLLPGQGIELRKISIYEPHAQGPQPMLLEVEELVVSCSTSVEELLQGKLEIKQFLARRPTLHVTRRTDGTWSASRLLPLPKFDDHPLNLIIENGAVEIFDTSRNPSSTLSLHDINVHIRRANAPGEPSRFDLEGQLTGDNLRRAEVQGATLADGSAWAVRGKFESIDLAPDLYRSLPAECDKALAELRALRAPASGNFAVSYRKGQPLDFSVDGQVERGRIDDDRLPFPLTDVRAKFHCDRLGLRVQDFAALSGQTSVQLRLERSGYTPQSPMKLEMETRHLVLDRQVLDVLPESLKIEWYKFFPAGELDLDVKLAFDGQKWQPDITAHLLNVAFTYHKFPYRLEGGRGKMELRDDVLKMNLVAYSSGDEVRINGEMQSPGPNWTGEIQLQGENLPIDDKLMEAFNGKPRAALRAMAPHGSMDVFAKYSRERGADPKVADNGPLHEYVSLSVKHGSVRLKTFPYPIDNIRGLIELRDGVWTFPQLSGTNNSARINCDGIWEPHSGAGDLRLHFACQQVPLDEELRDALPEGAKRLWNELRPQGSVDLDSYFRYLPGEHRTSVWVKTTTIEDTVSIEPRAFPYRLEKFRGGFTYEDGAALIDNFTAQHGRTTISGKGHATVDRTGGWLLHFDKLAADRLLSDPDLVPALPERLRKAIIRLNLDGTVNMRGGIELSSTGELHQPVTSSWDVDLDCQNAAINCGVQLTGLFGGVKLTGSFDGKHFQSRGELHVDSVNHNNFQFTEIRGPLWMDDTRLLIGSYAEQAAPGTRGRSATAKLYQGTLLTDGWITLGDVPSYHFYTSLAQGNLARWAQETLPGKQKFTGEIFANAELYGQGTSLNGLGGRGNLQLRNADIYELPVMVALLKILSIRPPDTSAFSKSDVDFRINGEHVYLDRVDFNGDAVSLLGKGEIGLNRDVHLVFHTMVGRDELRIPLLHEVMGGASQQIMLIHVDGTLDEPNTRKEVFPGLAQALEALQSEFGGTGGPTNNTLIPPLGSPPKVTSPRR